MKKGGCILPVCILDWGRMVNSSRGSTPHVDVNPSRAVQNRMLTKILIDSEASVETCRRLGTELKPKCTTLVEYMYNFNTSQAPASVMHNARRTRELLRDLNFIYPVRRCHPSLQPRNLELVVIHTAIPSSNELSTLLGFVTRMVLESWIINTLTRCPSRSLLLRSRWYDHWHSDQALILNTY